MADRYWWPSGGTGSSTGNWSSTTNWSSSSASYVSAAAPTSADNANFGPYSGATAFTVTLVTAPACANLVINNANMTLAGSATLSIASGVTVTSFASRTYTGAITFVGTGVLSFGSMTLASAITFNTIGGTWTLGSALSTTGAITLTNGTLDTSSAGNYSLTASGIALGAGTKTLNLNASTVTLTGGAPITFTTNATGFTFNAGTSQITCSTSTITFAGNGNTFYDVSAPSASSYTLTGANTFNNFTIGATIVAVNTFTITGNQTVNGTFSVNVSSLGWRTNQIVSSTYGLPVTITANAVALSNVIFRDVIGAGAATWTGTRIGDAGGNSGITFDAPRIWYWTGASGNWASNSWATTMSGTPASANFPLPQDTAIFTNFNPATASSVTLNGPHNLPTIDFSGRTLAMTWATSTTSPYALGSITLSSAITTSGTGNITFGNRTGTATITSAGVTWTQPFTFSNIGATVQFGDAFASSNTLTHSYGALNAQTYNVTCTLFSSTTSNTRTLSLGSGTWTITGSGSQAWNLGTVTGLTLNAGTSTISLTSASSKTFGGGSKTYYNLNQGGSGALVISQSNTFNNITNSAQPTTVTFAASSTNTFANFNLNGTAGNLVTINSSTAGTRANLVKTGANVSCDYLSIKDTAAS